MAGSFEWEAGRDMNALEGAFSTTNESETGKLFQTINPTMNGGDSVTGFSLGYTLKQIPQWAYGGVLIIGVLALLPKKSKR